MNRTPIVIVTCFGMLIAAPALTAVVVPETNILLDKMPLFDGNHSLTVYQDAVATDYTSVWLEYDGAAIEIVNWNIDEESDWYLVEAGDEFGEKNIASDLFTPIFTTDSPRGPISVGTDFYLGVSTGIGYYGYPIPTRDVFGWVHLKWDGTKLVNDENAMAYGCEGIVVGTNTAIPPIPNVPEPCSLVMLVPLALALLLY